MAFASDRAAKRPCPFRLSGAGHLRSKTAFSRFPPVDRTDLKGWLRVEHAPFAEWSGERIPAEGRLSTSTGQIAAVDVVVGGKRSSAPNVTNYGWGELLEMDPGVMPIPNPFMMPPMFIFGFTRSTALASGVLASPL
jgi:hypothetical protein